MHLTLAGIKLKMEFHKVVILLYLLTVVGCDSEKEAIHKAEEFVIEQGYAHKKIDLEFTATDLDVIERSVLNRELISEWRYNSLVPKAIYTKKQENGWLIGFRYTEEDWDLDTTIIPLRQVIVYDDGLIDIMHEDLVISTDSLLIQNAR